MIRHINILLFVLTANVTGFMILVLTTVISWWFLCDYYIVRWWGLWPEWLEHCGFLFVPLTCLIAAYLCVLCRLAKAHWKEDSRSQRLLVGQLDQADAQTWVDMLNLGASQCSGLHRRYLEWYRDRVATLSPAQMMSSTSVGHVWWGTRRTLGRVWAIAVFLPILWIALIVVPLSTEVVEQLAERIDRSPKEIFDVMNAVEVMRDPKSIKLEEALEINPQTRSFSRSTTSLLEHGSLTVRATDFPRAYRHIKAECKEPNCRIIGSTDVPLRAGRAILAFEQAPSQLFLNMNLELKTNLGRTLDSRTIEPIRRQHE